MLTFECALTLSLELSPFCIGQRVQSKCWIANRQSADKGSVLISNCYARRARFRRQTSKVKKL